MELLARDIMQRKVRSVHPDMTLAELEDFLLRERIGGAPVLERDQLVGVVSRSDLVRLLSLDRSLAGLAAEASPELEFAPCGAPQPLPLPPRLDRELGRRKVRDAMVPEPVTVSPGTPVREVARIMVEQHLHRILVTDAGKLVGIITSLDIARLVATGRA